MTEPVNSRASVIGASIFVGTLVLILIALLIVNGGIKSTPVEERPDFQEWQATRDMDRCERGWYEIARDGDLSEWPEGQRDFMEHCYLLEPAIP